MLGSLVYLIFSALIVSAQIDKVENVVEGCGCGAGIVAPLRNPYVCTPDQLKRAAIALSDQLMSYMEPYNPSALFNFVPPSTPVYTNLLNPDRECCQTQTDLYQYMSFLVEERLQIFFTPQIPAGAVVSDFDCTVKVYVAEAVAPEMFLTFQSNQMVFIWKPLCVGQVIPDCNCNLQLERIELRGYSCQFGEARCTA